MLVTGAILTLLVLLHYPEELSDTGQAVSALPRRLAEMEDEEGAISRRRDHRSRDEALTLNPAAVPVARLSMLLASKVQKLRSLCWMIFF